MLALKKPSVLPGFAFTLGFSLFYLSLIVLIPLSTLFVKTAGSSWPAFWHAAADSRALHAYAVSFSCAFAAALINCFFGLIVAWVLVRYRFPFRRVADALVDLPFALPTAVAGIALATLYAPGGWIGSLLAPLGIKVAFTPLGILVALLFVGLPFVVRTVQPVLQDIDLEIEEAAAALGASRWQTFVRITLPSIAPALLAGFAMAFARGLGEYGSVIFIAGNIPHLSEIAPLLIVVKLEQFDTAGASSIALVMLLAAFIMLLLVNRIQHWSNARMAAA